MPGFKTGLARRPGGTGNFGLASANVGDLALTPPPAPAPAAAVPAAAPAPDDPNRALMAALALQGTTGDPFQPGGLSATLTQGLQPAPIQPQPIVQPQAALTGPLPISRPLM